MPPFDDEFELIADERGSASSGYRVFGFGSIEPPVSPETDPFGAFFDYAARHLTAHLGSAPVDFNLDDVLELASPTSARHRAWLLESWVRYPYCSLTMKPSALCLVAGFGNVTALEQQLDRLAQNSDGDRRRIVAAAAKMVIKCKNLGNFQTLVNHRSTTMAMQTAEMLWFFMKNWERFAFRSDNLTERTRLIGDLFETLASDTTSIPSPNYLLLYACVIQCMPVIIRLCEWAKADPAFQRQLMQPTGGIGPLGDLALKGDVATLRYLCQQDGIEAHASNRDIFGGNILSTLSCPKLEIIELLLDKFPWLASERGGGDEALRGIISLRKQTPDNLKAAKLLLQHVQATPGLVVDVDELLALAAWHEWHDMCQMLIVDGHADP